MCSLASHPEDRVIRLMQEYSMEQKAVIKQLNLTLVAMAKRLDACQQEKRHLQLQLSDLLGTKSEHHLISLHDKSEPEFRNTPRPATQGCADVIVSENELISDKLSEGPLEKEFTGEMTNEKPPKKELMGDKVLSIIPPSQQLCQQKEIARNDRGKTIRRQNSEESRKFNLIMYGIPEDIQEGCCDCVLKVRQFIENVTAAEDTADVTPITIEHAYRLGGHSALRDKPRPILVKFADLRQRRYVLNSARKMGKGGSIRVTEEYSAITQEVCKLLVRHIYLRKLLNRSSLETGDKTKHSEI